MFPVKSLFLKSKGKENPFRIKNDLNNSFKEKNKKPGGKKTAINAAREMFKELSPTFNKWAGMTLGEALAKVPEANLEVKKSPVERKKIRRNILRSAKEDTESKLQETSLQR